MNDDPSTPQPLPVPSDGIYENWSYRRLDLAVARANRDAYFAVQLDMIRRGVRFISGVYCSWPGSETHERHVNYIDEGFAEEFLRRLRDVGVLAPARYPDTYSDAKLARKAGKAGGRGRKKDG